MLYEVITAQGPVDGGQGGGQGEGEDIACLEAGRGEPPQVAQYGEHCQLGGGGDLDGLLAVRIWFGRVEQQGLACRRCGRGVEGGRREALCVVLKQNGDELLGPPSVPAALQLGP